MGKKKKQHFVPESYLKAWCDIASTNRREPYLWMFSKDGSEAKSVTASNIFHEKDFYTLKGISGTRDLQLEDGLASLEGLFVELRRSKLLTRQPLSTDDRLVVCAFAVAMNQRTKLRRDSLRAQWQRILNLGDQVSEWANSATPEQLEQATHLMGQISDDSTILTFGDVQDIVDQPMPTLLPIAIDLFLPILMTFNLTIFETRDNPGFITSDNPCIWFDAEAYRLPKHLQGPILAYPNVEVTLPISPNQLLVFSRYESRSYVDVTGLRMADELNKRTRVFADQYIIVNQNITKEYWFSD